MSASIEYMVTLFLKKYNYDGLFCEIGECGCDLNDLFACQEPNARYCKAAYRFDCSRCLDGANYNNDCKLNGGEYDYMMSADADYCHPMYVEAER